MKSEVVSEPVRASAGETAARAAETVANAVSADENDETDEELFKEIPTVSNRARPLEIEAPPASPAQPSEGAGTYRILRPTTSDFVAAPIVTKTEPPAAKRLAIGMSRKPR